MPAPGSAAGPPLRIALMLESDGPGGAEVMLLNLADALRGRGHHVVPVGPADGCGWLAAAFRGRGFEPEVFRLSRAVDPACVAGLGRLLRRRAIDVVHSHEFTMAVYGAAAARLAGRPHLITMHGGGYFAGRWRRRAALRWAMRRSHATVAVAESTRRTLRDALGRGLPIDVIPNGIARRPGRPGARAALGLQPGHPLLVAVGNLYPVKGHAVLLQALGMLRGTDPGRSWTLAIVGRGGEERSLRALARREGIADRVRLLGFRDDVPDLLAAADAFVLPSLSEGLPLALLEAMAAGKPVVASGVGGIPEAARDGREALLVPPGDPRPLADALRRVLADPDLRARLGQAAATRVTRSFGIEAMTDAYERLYRAALAPNGDAGAPSGPPRPPGDEPASPDPRRNGRPDRALRIQHVIAPAPVGGAEAVVGALASGQRSNGHRVAVTAILSDDSRPLFLDALERDGVDVFRVRVGAKSYLRERSEVAALCRRFRADILHTHGYRADVVDGSIRGSFGVPAVSTVHGFIPGDLKARFYQAVQRRALRRFDAVVAVSRPLGESLARSGVPRPRLHVIANAWAAGAPPLRREEARRALAVDGAGFHVAWVGRLGWEKGPDVILDALRCLDGLPLTLHMIGDGPEGPVLAARTRGDPRVRWHGLVPDAGRLLPAFDAFVLSSRTEGTPIALLEAIAAGVPVVATRVGGVPDVVRASEALLVPPADPAALARALRALHADPDGAAARARAATARLQTTFAPTPWLERYDAVYHDVLTTTAPG